MTNIELTKEHKDKLLEMANNLFAGTFFQDNIIKNIKLSNQQGSCGIHSSEQSKIFVYISTDYGFPINIIHWFEFVMTHLSDKIASLKEESRLDIIKYNDYYRLNENNHVIDCLYKQFKELK